jgi:hypothetical protein
LTKDYLPGAASEVLGFSPEHLDLQNAVIDTIGIIYWYHVTLMGFSVKEILGFDSSSGNQNFIISIMDKWL